jgi:hypothetical protein
MRVGDEVTLGTAGGSTPARVTAVVDAGPSGYKVLNLVTAAGLEYPRVENVRDNTVRYWCAGPDELVAPKRRRKAPVHVEDDE